MNAQCMPISAFFLNMLLLIRFTTSHFSWRKTHFLFKVTSCKRKYQYLRRRFSLVRWLGFLLLFLPLVAKEIKAKWSFRTKSCQTNGCSVCCQGVERRYRHRLWFFSTNIWPTWQWHNPVLPMKEFKCGAKVWPIFKNWTFGSSNLKKRNRINISCKNQREKTKLILIIQMEEQRGQRTNYRNREIHWRKWKACGLVDIPQKWTISECHLHQKDSQMCLHSFPETKIPLLAYL